MPNEVQNNKPKAVRNCLGLLTSQLDSVLLSYCKDGYRNTRQVDKVQIGTLFGLLGENFLLGLLAVRNCRNFLDKNRSRICRMKG